MERKPGTRRQFRSRNGKGDSHDRGEQREVLEKVLEKMENQYFFLLLVYSVYPKNLKGGKSCLRSLKRRKSPKRRRHRKAFHTVRQRPVDRWLHWGPAPDERVVHHAGNTVGTSMKLAKG